MHGTDRADCDGSECVKTEPLMARILKQYCDENCKDCEFWIVYEDCEESWKCCRIRRPYAWSIGEDYDGEV